MGFFPHRISVVLLYILITSFLTACSISQKVGVVTLELNKDHVEENLCQGVYEVEYKLQNGSGYALQEYYQLADGRKFNANTEGEIAFLQAETKRYTEHLDNIVTLYKKKFYKNDGSAPDIMQVAQRMTNVITNDLSLNSSNEEAFEWFSNELGMKEFVHSRKKFISNIHQTPIDSRALKNIANHFVPQSDPNICWAASLETTFKYVGKQYKQEEFVSALKEKCPAKLSNTASVNQMLFAVTDRHLSNDGRWMGEFSMENYADIGLGKLLRAFSQGPHEHRWIKPIQTAAITWGDTRKTDGRLVSKGKIKIIKSIAELILAIDANYPVIAGLKQSQGGHTVVVSKIEFRPGGNLNADNVYELDHRAYLNYVYYLDPASGIRKKSGDYFLENTAFMIYIAP